jgi:hypothetical protein
MTIGASLLGAGEYLLRLEASNRHMAFIPLTVRAAAARGKVMPLDAVTTWQAYKLWRCCDLYVGGDGSFGSRSRAASFDRPYLNWDGAGQFIRVELGIVAEAERLGLPLDYVTDVDLQANSHILDGARALVSMGDEYWSPRMRAIVTALATMGRSFLRRQRHLPPHPFRIAAYRPYRLEINYKVVSVEATLSSADDENSAADCWRPSMPSSTQRPSWTIRPLSRCRPRNDLDVEPMLLSRDAFFGPREDIPAKEAIGRVTAEQITHIRRVFLHWLRRAHHRRNPRLPPQSSCGRHGSSRPGRPRAQNDSGDRAAA